MSNILQHLEAKNYGVYDYAWISDQIVRYLFNDYPQCELFPRLFLNVSTFVIIDPWEFIKWCKDNHECIKSWNEKDGHKYARIEDHPGYAIFPNITHIYTSGYKLTNMDSLFPNLKKIIIYDAHDCPNMEKYKGDKRITHICKTDNQTDRMATMIHDYFVFGYSDLDRRDSALIHSYEIVVHDDNFENIRNYVLLYNINVNPLIEKMPNLNYLYAIQLSNNEYSHMNLKQFHLYYDGMSSDKNIIVKCPKLQQFSFYTQKEFAKFAIPNLVIKIYTDNIPAGVYNSKDKCSYVQTNHGTIEVMGVKK